MHTGFANRLCTPFSLYQVCWLLLFVFFVFLCWGGLWKFSCLRRGRIWGGRRAGRRVLRPTGKSIGGKLIAYRVFKLNSTHPLVYARYAVSCFFLCVLLFAVVVWWKPLTSRELRDQVDPAADRYQHEVLQQPGMHVAAVVKQGMILFFSYMLNAVWARSALSGRARTMLSVGRLWRCSSFWLVCRQQ